MNHSTRKRLLRIGVRLLLVFVGLVVFYVLSSGPAAAWVANTVSGRSISSLNPALYDARLHRYRSFYGRLLYARGWLRFHDAGQIAGVFQQYEDLFCGPCRLADGRLVFTMACWDESKLPQAQLTEWFHSNAAATMVTLPPETRIYALPRTGRVLVVLAPDENPDDRYALDWPVEDSEAGFAQLQLPPEKSPNKALQPTAGAGSVPLETPALPRPGGG